MNSKQKNSIEKRKEIPAGSVLLENLTEHDYFDSYAAKLSRSVFELEAFCQAFFTSSPPWVKSLFRMRNRIVSLFGLKTADETRSEKILCEEGEKVGLFHIYKKNKNEIILGENDRHLDFRVSLLVVTLENEGLELIISTTVRFHNWMGKLYFFPVKFFHTRIVRILLRRIVQRLDSA